MPPTGRKTLEHLCFSPLIRARRAQLVTLACRAGAKVKKRGSGSFETPEEKMLICRGKDQIPDCS